MKNTVRDKEEPHVSVGEINDTEGREGERGGREWIEGKEAEG